jgi:hypothetical protein
LTAIVDANAARAGWFARVPRHAVNVDRDAKPRARSTLAAITTRNVDRAGSSARCATLPSPSRHFALPLDAPLTFVSPRA